LGTSRLSFAALQLLVCLCMHCRGLATVLRSPRDPAGRHGNHFGTVGAEGCRCRTG
jgi:hypothetical protein